MNVGLLIAVLPEAGFDIDQLAGGDSSGLTDIKGGEGRFWLNGGVNVVNETYRIRLMKRVVLSLVAGCLVGQPVQAEDGEPPDLALGEEINEVCAGCHGEFGQGGKDGEYPRVAGQPAAFIARQLRLFRARERQNMPMLPHTEERELRDEDVVAVSAYLAQIELRSTLPPIDEEKFNAFQRLKLAEQVVNIARHPGDADAGGRLYRRECGGCHGGEGEGDRGDGVPMLAGQYTNYLQRQIGKYLAGERIHDEEAPDSDFLASFSEQEMNDIFAWLSLVDDG